MSVKLQDILVDTNVWLDYLDPSRAGHQDAFNLIAYACQEGHLIMYPLPILKDVFYLVAGNYKAQIRNEQGCLTESDALVASEIAWACLEQIRSIATGVGVDESDAWLACKMRSLHGDFEDNLVIAAAQRAESTYVVTSDKSLISHAPVVALQPKDALEALKMAD